ncbi:MAG: hypothetical protein HY290_30245 [Planctomycetia bacterium]|nr:hypothetical protein [Planctomycetia bacterium]
MNDQFWHNARRGFLIFAIGLVALLAYLVFGEQPFGQKTFPASDPSFWGMFVYGAVVVCLVLVRFTRL